MTCEKGHVLFLAKNNNTTVSGGKTKVSTRSFYALKTFFTEKYDTISWLFMLFFPKIWINLCIFMMIYEFLPQENCIKLHISFFKIGIRKLR